MQNFGKKPSILDAIAAIAAMIEISHD